MSNFATRYGTGETYKKYAAIAHKFTDEFRRITLDLMIETYIREQLDRKGMHDYEFLKLRQTWALYASDLGILEEYPYSIWTFTPAHPYARDASILAKERFGLSL